MNKLRLPIKKEVVIVPCKKIDCVQCEMNIPLTRGDGFGEFVHTYIHEYAELDLEELKKLFT